MGRRGRGLHRRRRQPSVGLRRTAREGDRLRQGPALTDDLSPLRRSTKITSLILSQTTYVAMTCATGWGWWLRPPRLGRALGTMMASGSDDPPVDGGGDRSRPGVCAELAVDVG